MLIYLDHRSSEEICFAFKPKYKNNFYLPFCAFAVPFSASMLFLNHAVLKFINSPFGVGELTYLQI